MKIAYIANARPPSRAANTIQVMKMCEALSRLGHSVTLYLRRACQGGGAADADVFSFYGVKAPFELCYGPITHKHIHCVVSAVRAARGGFELCYTRSAPGAVACAAFGMPTVFEIHRPPATRHGRWAVGKIIRSPNVLTVAISDALRRSLLERFAPADEGAVVARHDGVDLEAFTALPPREELRRELGLEAQRRYVCYAGSLYEGRGIDTLIEAASLLVDAAEFLIVGGTPEAVDRYRAAASEKGARNVRFTGFVRPTEVPRYLASADVLVIPPEGRARGVGGEEIGLYMSPLKMFEYMASGTPIVASDLPTLREVLHDGRNALVFPPGDARALAAAVESVFREPAAARAMAERALEDVKRYTWEERAARIVEAAASRLLHGRG